MAYGVKAMSPIEVGLLSPRRLHFNEISNENIRWCELDFFEEKRDDSQINLASYQLKMAMYCKVRMRKKSFPRYNFVC